jgi:site-specific DNA-methyltransferase (adenine-specific)
MRVKCEFPSKLSTECLKKVSWSVWEMGVSYTKGHPAPFPNELPSRLIQLYTVEGETVLDPFGGTGTTMKVVRNLK